MLVKHQKKEAKENEKWVLNILLNISTTRLYENLTNLGFHFAHLAYYMSHVEFLLLINTEKIQSPPALTEDAAKPTRLKVLKKHFFRFL